MPAVLYFPEPSSTTGGLYVLGSCYSRLGEGSAEMESGGPESSTLDNLGQQYLYLGNR